MKKITKIEITSSTVAIFLGIFILVNFQYVTSFLIVLTGIIVFLTFLLKKEWLLYSIVLVLFLEGYVFSFYFFGARIRIVQVLEVISICCLLLWLLVGKSRLKKTPIDFPLRCYILVNFIAIVNAAWIARSVKIAILLLSLATLYYVIINLLTSRKIFDRAFNLLLYIGFMEIIYGLYQVLAGMSNYAFGSNLPVGYLGVVHKEYIGSPWGRPYGTLQEPDVYGAVCLFYALVFISLHYSKIKEKRKFYFYGMIISLLGLFFSFVRAAWVGFIAGTIFLLFYKYKSKLSKLNLTLYIKKTSFFVFILLFGILLSPSLRTILRERFYPVYSGAQLSSENVRFQQMKTSFRFFLRRPLIGNGPGSAAFNYLVEERGEEYAKDIIKDKISLGRSGGFNPSIIATVLEDTGIVGLILFLILIGKILSYNLKMIPLIDSNYSLKALGLFGGLIGLFVSFLFSQFFWMPFTWVFIAFNITVLRLGVSKENDATKS